MNNFEWMRNRIFHRLCNEAHIPPWPQGHTLSTMLETVYSYEFIVRAGLSTEFATAMRNRLLVGACRYGVLGQYPTKYMTRLYAKAFAYTLTGSLDLLPDIANYAMFEWMRNPCKGELITIAHDMGKEFDKPTHPNAHWPTTNTGDRDDHT